MTEKDDNIRYDKIGQEIREGSIVAVPNSKSEIKICRVTKLMPKMISCENVNTTKSGRAASYNKYANEVICLDEMEATVLYLMTRNL